jgi:hypothetical protein
LAEDADRHRPVRQVTEAAQCERDTRIRLRRVGDEDVSLPHVGDVGGDERSVRTADDPPLAVRAESDRLTVHEGDTLIGG